MLSAVSADRLLGRARDFISSRRGANSISSILLEPMLLELTPATGMAKDEREDERVYNSS